MRDLGLTQVLSPLVSEPVVSLLILVTALGAPKFIAVASTAGSIAGVGTGRIEVARARRFLVAVALTLSVSILLKHGLAMPRPPEALMAIPEDGYGFPSGHATASAGLATAFVGVARRNGYWPVVLGGAFVSIIAATRVLLGVHYLLDVLAGIVLGVLVASIGLCADRIRPRLTLAATAGIVIVAMPVWAFL